MNIATLDSDTTTADSRTVALHFTHAGEAVPLTVTITATSPFAMLRNPLVEEFLKAFVGSVEASTPSRRARRKSRRRR